MPKVPKRLFALVIALAISAQLAIIEPLHIIPTAQASNYFIDVPSVHPNYKAISTLRRLNIIRGFVDSTFKPYKNLTRAELLKLAISSKGINVGSPANISLPFTDVSKMDWFAPYVQFALNSDMISRSSDHRFNPHQLVSRAEAIKILLNLYEMELPSNIAAEPYDDVALDNWAIKYVWAAKVRRLFPVDETSFQPEFPITRGLASELVYRILAITTNEAIRYSDDLEVDFSALVLADQTEDMEGRDQILDRAFVQLDELTKRAIEQVSKSTVSIISFETDKRQVQNGGGSGIIVTSDGIIMTNKHVVSQGAEAGMVLHNGELFDYEIIAVDPLFDLAIIKIDKGGLIPAILGNSDEVKIGQTVIGLGYSLSLYQDSVTRGIISGRSRTISASGGGVVETLSGMLQTDTAISPGNSGGPLFNLWGEVVGINTAIDTRGTNLAFAIPVNDLKCVIADAIATGKLVRPFLGVRFVTLNSLIARSNNYPSKHGAILLKGALNESAIVKDSPADKAGLKENDIILKVNEAELDEDNNTLLNIIQRYRPDDTVTLTILRDGQLKTMQLRIGSKTAEIPHYTPSISTPRIIITLP